jgi:hypothetical protein
VLPVSEGAEWKGTTPLYKELPGQTLIFLDFGLARGKINIVPGASSVAKAMVD